MKHIGYLASALLAFSFALSGQTTVTDTIKTPVNGTNFTGTVQIIGPAVTYDGVTYAKAARRIRVTAGVFSVTLIPNVGASPSGTSYAVRFTADEGISWDETWTVTDSGTPVTIGSIRSTVPAPSTVIAFSQLPACAEAEIIKFVSGAWACSATGSGTVSSVGLSLPSELTVSNSPVTTTGTLTAVWADQTTNKFFGSPNGTTGTPSFRALAAADIPSLAAAKITSGTLDTARLGSGSATSSTFLRGDQTWQVVTSGPATTDDLAEGVTNLYHTTARARATVSATSPLAYNSSTGVFSMPVAATGGVSGYLSGTDWGTFNGKENALTFSAPLDRSGNTISCLVASGSQAGCLSSTDWTTFNGKAAASHSHAASDVTSGTLPVANGGTGLSSGTSGGVPYFSASSTIASSGALTANLPVIGGGAGSAPTVGTVQGNTTKFTTYAGSAPSTDDCAKFDSNGNITTAGAACGSGGGGSGNGALILVEEKTASSSASLDFTSCFTSTYDNYLIQIQDLLPATDGAALAFRVSTDGGSSYVSSSSYQWTNHLGSTSAGAVVGSASATLMAFTFNQSADTALYGFSGNINAFNPRGSSLRKIWQGSGMLYTSADIPQVVNFFGVYAATTAVTAFQILADSGNLASGKAYCYAYAKTGSPGGGDVTGPASATSGNIPTFSGTTGKIIQDGGKALPSGSVVGTSDTQTLTAKTLTLPIATSYTVAGLPAAGTAGRIAVVTDAATAGDCDTGSGSALAFCRDSGAAWVPLGDGGGSGGSGDVVGPTSSVDGEVALFDSTTGKLLKRATGTGPAKLTSGGLSASAVNLASEVTGTLPNGNTTAASTNTASAIVTRDGSGNFAAGTITAALSGNSTTATALAANGTNCASGEYARGVDASGNAESCTAAAPTITGMWFPFGFMNSAISGPTLGSANRVYYSQFNVWQPFSFSRYHSYTRTGGTGTQGWAIMDSSCNLISGTTATVTAPGTSGAYGLAIGSTVTLQPGTYYIAWTSTDSAEVLFGTTASDYNNRVAIAGLSSSDSVFFYGSNASSSGVVPSSCGTRTVSNAHQFIIGLR